MTIKESVKAMLKDNKRSQVWLAEKMGYAGQSSVGQMLSRGNLTVETLCRICEIMEYEVTVQPKRRAGARPAGQIVIDGREEKE